LTLHSKQAYQLYKAVNMLSKHLSAWFVYKFIVIT